jgi:hypothetical protein
MKSAAKIPFKGKKTPYNLNEVDVNLLLKNPSHIRKVVKGNYKEESNYDEDESEEEEEEEEEGEDDKLESHMKRYITEYFDNKYNKERDQRKKVKQRFDFIDNYIPKFPYNAVTVGKTLTEIKDEVQKRRKLKNSK